VWGLVATCGQAMTLWDNLLKETLLVLETDVSGLKWKSGPLLFRTFSQNLVFAS